MKTKATFILLASFLIVLTMLPLSLQANIKAKSCLQIKESTDIDRNGFYILYDSLNRPFATFCDFQSDVGFIWTLIESLSFVNAKNSKYQKSYFYNVPTGSCAINWLEFRLCKASMKSIADSAGSTHFRATCNFNKEDNIGLQNHRDYMRVSFCRYPNFFTNKGVNQCTKIDYVNIRGHTCRQCNIPLYDGGRAYHILLELDYAAKVCDKWSVPGTLGKEYDFGDYKVYNPKFSCSNSSASTTNWWIGGSYIP